MRYAAIREYRGPVPRAGCCALLEVSPSAYYAWRRRRASARAWVNRQLVALMQRIHQEVDRTYGSPRMHAELRAQGQACGRHRVARLMRTHGIRAKQPRRYRVTTESGHAQPVAPNRLGRAFTAAAPNQVWMGDITFVWTREGWCYLAVLLDAFSRRVVGWALGDQLTTALPLAALRQAIATRQPPPGLLHHTDRGSQYASAEYQAELAAHGMVCSMSRKGDCWDNAVVESFFHTLKGERLRDRRYATRAEAAADLEAYIEGFYNRRRRHSTLGQVSPIMYELHHAA